MTRRTYLLLLTLASICGVLVWATRSHHPAWGNGDAVKHEQPIGHEVQTASADHFAEQPGDTTATPQRSVARRMMGKEAPTGGPSEADGKRSITAPFGKSGRLTVASGPSGVELTWRCPADDGSRGMRAGFAGGRLAPGRS